MPGPSGTPPASAARGPAGGRVDDPPTRGRPHDDGRRGLGDVRVDPVTGARVVVAASRQQRPNRPSAACPFCVGGTESPEPYRVRAFVNRWPSFPDDRCEVVLYTPEHDATFPDLGRDGARRVVDLWADRTSALGARDDVDYVLVFENRGAEVGATVSHPHGQVFALDTVPDAPLAELRRIDRDQCPLCERPDPSLFVADADGWRAWVPAASTHPYELVLAPIVHRGDLPSLDGPQRDGLGDLLVDVLGRLDRLFGEPLPYMLWIHQRPTDGGLWPAAHLHVHIASPMRGPGVQRYVAAGELGSGLFINPVVPEDAAAALRGA